MPDKIIAYFLGFVVEVATNYYSIATFAGVANDLSCLERLGHTMGSVLIVQWFILCVELG